MPKKKIITKAEAVAMIIREAKCRIGCKDFTPTLTLHRSEPASPVHYPQANWDATPENPERWSPDCAQAFREAVTRIQGKYDIDWRHDD